jgi:hypothetical protein
MAEEKPLTKSDVVAALKTVGVATKEDVRQIVGEEIRTRGLATKGQVEDSVHHQLTEFHADMTLPQIQGFRQAMEEGFGELGGKINQLAAEVSYLKDEVRGLKAEFAATPSRRDLEELKHKVERYYPAN